MTCIHCNCTTCRGARSEIIDKAAEAMRLREQGETWPRIAEALGTTIGPLRKLIKQREAVA